MRKPRNKYARPTDLTTVRLDVTLTPHQAERLIGMSFHYGFFKEEPRKGWTNAERREAIRDSLFGIINEHITKL